MLRYAYKKIVIVLLTMTINLAERMKGECAAVIYDKIAALAKEKGISIMRLERETGLGTGTIGKWVKSSPSVSLLKKVADYFGKTVDYFVTDSSKG